MRKLLVILAITFSGVASISDVSYAGHCSGGKCRVGTRTRVVVRGVVKVVRSRPIRSRLFGCR